MMRAVGQFLDFLDRRAVFRRVAFVVVLMGTWRVTDWALGFADRWLLSPKAGIDSGAVIAAVTAPFAALQAAVLKWYSEARRDDP